MGEPKTLVQLGWRVLDPADVREWVTLAEAVGEGTPGAMRRFLERTGKVVTPLEVRSDNQPHIMVQRLALPDLPVPLELSDDDARGLLTALLTGALKGAVPENALAVLGAALNQAHMADLVYWPSTRTPTDPDALLKLARSVRGRALAPYLDPSCQPADPGPVVRAHPAVRAAVRPVLVEMAEAGEVELAMGEATVHALALAMPALHDAGAFVAWLSEAEGIGEVFADDDTLQTRLLMLRRSAAVP